MLYKERGSWDSNQKRFENLPIFAQDLHVFNTSSLTPGGSNIFPASSRYPFCRTKQVKKHWNRSSSGSTPLLHSPNPLWEAAESSRQYFLVFLNSVSHTWKQLITFLTQYRVSFSILAETVGWNNLTRGSTVWFDRFCDAEYAMKQVKITRRPRAFCMMS